MAGQSTFSIEKFSLSRTVVGGRPQWEHALRPHMYLIVDSSPLHMASSRRSATCRTLRVMENATCLECVNIEELSRDTQIAIRDAKGKGIDLVPGQYLVSATIRYPLVALRYSVKDSKIPRRIQVKLTSDQDYNFVVDFLKDVQCHITLPNEAQRPVTAVGTSNANGPSIATTPFPFSVRSNSGPMQPDDVDHRSQSQSYVKNYQHPSHLPQDHQYHPQQYPQYPQQIHAHQQQFQYLSPQAQQQPSQSSQSSQQFPLQHQQSVLPHSGFYTPYSDNSQSVQHQQHNLRFPNYSTLSNLEGSIGLNGLRTNDQTMASPAIAMNQSTAFMRPNSRPSTAPTSHVPNTMLGQLSGVPSEADTLNRPTSKADRPGTAGAKDGIPTSRLVENKTTTTGSKAKAIKKAPASTTKDRRALNVRDGNAASRPRSRPLTAASKAKSATKGSQDTTTVASTDDTGILSQDATPQMPPPPMLLRSTSTNDQLPTSHESTHVERLIHRVSDTFDTANALQQLAAYASQDDRNRQQALAELIFEAMNNEEFVKLCEEVEGSWRMIGLPGL